MSSIRNSDSRREVVLEGEEGQQQGRGSSAERFKQKMQEK
jgi:hypothetical protein